MINAVKTQPAAVTRTIIKFQPAVGLNSMMHAIGKPGFGAVRQNFISMPDKLQAKVIGDYAKSMVRKANGIISNSGTFAPDAAAIWNSVITTKGSMTSANIKAMFPQLERESADISAVLNDIPAFWVNEVYSVDGSGKRTIESVKASKALQFSPEMMEAVNKASGLSFVGETIKGLANERSAEILERVSTSPVLPLTLDSILLAVETRRFGVAREKFLHLPFEAQAQLIGEYAGFRQQQVEKLIAMYMKENAPSAIQVWETIISGPAGSASSKIIEAYPELAPISEKLGNILEGCYAFWVNRFYSCNKNGYVGTTSAQFSAAARFNEKQMALINELSGMRNLGGNIRSYANYLYMSAD